MTKYVYKVFHGWAFPVYVTEFKTMKEAITFIQNQEYPEEWCYSKTRISKRVVL